MLLTTTGASNRRHRDGCVAEAGQTSGVGRGEEDLELAMRLLVCLLPPTSPSSAAHLLAQPALASRLHLPLLLLLLAAPPLAVKGLLQVN